MKYHIEFDLELKRNPYKGKYIAIEGIDASGKTTQVSMLSDYFHALGKKVVIVSEPSDRGEVGDLIRSILAGKEKIPLVALQYLFTADRSIQHENKIIPALQEGKIVISSRCFWSAIPYGIMDKGISEYNDADADLLMCAQGILSMYNRFIAPDLTFYLHITSQIAMERLTQMDKDKEIYEKKQKLDRLVAGYDWLVKKFPEEFIQVDGEKIVEIVQKAILEQIKIKLHN